MKRRLPQEPTHVECDSRIITWSMAAIPRDTKVRDAFMDKGRRQTKYPIQAIGFDHSRWRSQVHRCNWDDDGHERDEYHGGHRCNKEDQNSGFICADYFLVDE